MFIRRKMIISLAAVIVISIAGYINYNMSTKQTFNDEEYVEYEEDLISEMSDDISEDDNFNYDALILKKERNNMEVIEYLEKNISNESFSEERKQSFEKLLEDKYTQIDLENTIDFLLETKGYKDTLVLVTKNNIKVITNLELTNEDTMKILDVIVSETSYIPAQIKIVKYNNNEL